jgi:hypothetical protein
MLAAAQPSNDEPDHTVVLQLAGSSQIPETLLSDLAAPSDSRTTAANVGAGAFFPRDATGGPGREINSTDISRIPRAYVTSPTAVGGSSEGPNSGSNPYYANDRGDERQTPTIPQEETPESGGHPSLYETVSP